MLAPIPKRRANCRKPRFIAYRALPFLKSGAHIQVAYRSVVCVCPYASPSNESVALHRAHRTLARRVGVSAIFPFG
jgi:hypothetical protein